ncbi:MAG: hypothetical protein KVP17_004775 [Porospora cf. gigantea B]|uniref:uncharacterized protein n=1 Tax=Porospora cf. gigantea B TaxID=2853592 RepID=UPI00357187D3|nr:MAG: hypothetical protein KVP17_004775 [Porospora cf. gigantea B]
MKEQIGRDSSDYTNKLQIGLNRFVVLGIYSFALVAAGPLLNNWAPLRAMLVAHGAYAETCHAGDPLDPDGTCMIQQNLLARLPVTAQSLQFAFAVVGGLFKDRLGSRVAGIVGFSTQAFAFLTIALASESFDGYLLGFIFLGAASEPLAMSLMDVANLFPGYEGTVIAMLGTSRSLSFWVANLLQLLFTSGCTFMMSWLIFFFIIVVVGIGTVLVIPADGYKPQKADMDAFSEERPQNLTILERIVDKRMWGPLTHPTYLLFVLYFTTVVLRMGFFSASSDTQIPDALQFYGLAVPFSFLPCPLFGLIADKAGHWFMIHIVNFCMLGMFICLLGDTEWSQYVAVVLNVFSISFQSSQAYTIIVKTVPNEFVGRLLGLCFLISGLLGLFNSVIYNATNESNGFEIVDGVFVGVTLTMTIAIVMMAISNRRRPMTPTIEGPMETTPEIPFVVVKSEDFDKQSLV